LIRFEKKIKILHLQKHSISYSYVQAGLKVGLQFRASVVENLVYMGVGLVVVLILLKEKFIKIRFSFEVVVLPSHKAYLSSRSVN